MAWAVTTGWNSFGKIRKFRASILGSLLWPFKLGAVVKYLSFSIHIMITVCEYNLD